MTIQSDETTPTPREKQAEILEAAITAELDHPDAPLLDWHQSLRAGAAALRSHDALVEALQRVNHTLVVHGHIDAGTPLHEFILATLRRAGAGVE